MTNKNATVTSEEVDAENNRRYVRLVEELKVSRIGIEHAHALHLWLVDKASERGLHEAISNAIGVKTRENQVKLCEMLIQYSSAIAEQFGFLNQVFELDVALSQVFRANQQNMSYEIQNSRQKLKNWADFRDRLATDCTLIADMAKQVLPMLQRAPVKKGRPAKKWRNEHIVELVNRILLLRSCTREEGIELATAIWKIYRPDDGINQPETAGRIINREKRRRRTQGQNAAKIAQFRP